MRWNKDGKAMTEYLERGMKFYKFKYQLLRVNIVEIEFIAFIESDKGFPVAIFKDLQEFGGGYESIDYFWRDLCLVESYPEGWYTCKDDCLEAGKKYYIDRINKS